MVCKLYRKTDESYIFMSDLKSGQLAVIIDDTYPHAKGQIVTPGSDSSERRFLILGASCANYYTGDNCMKVRKLEPCELIEV